jgi:hypothetical protein
MGHVIGLGTLWSYFNLVTPENTEPLYYLGNGGFQGQQDVGGTGQPIVEDLGGSGISRVHFDEKVYGIELMTAWLQADSKLSQLTAKSLEDLGFTVNLEATDPYEIPRPKKKLRYLRGGEQKNSLRYQMIDDILHIVPILDHATPYA